MRAEGLNGELEAVGCVKRENRPACLRGVSAQTSHPKALMSRGDLLQNVVLVEYVAILAINVKQVRLVRTIVAVSYALPYYHDIEAVLYAVHGAGTHTAAGRTAHQDNRVNSGCGQRAGKAGAEKRTGILLMHDKFRMELDALAELVEGRCARHFRTGALRVHAPPSMKLPGW